MRCSWPEARGNLDGAVVLAEKVWGDRLRSGHLLWTLLAGPDVARVAKLAGADSLLRRVVADLAEVPTDQAPTLAGVVPLVRSIASGDADLAAQAAHANQRAGARAGRTVFLGAGRSGRRGRR